jgi:dsRNA-specific ribonuclease
VQQLYPPSPTCLHTFIRILYPQTTSHPTYNIYIHNTHSIMTPTTPNKLLSMSSPDSSPSRLPIRQKGSLLIPDLPTLTLPPLPDITNPAIKNLALTHSSNHAGQSSRKRDLIYNQAEAVLDNEKLEHVGDGLLSKLDVAYVAVIES